MGWSPCGSGELTGHSPDQLYSPRRLGSGFRIQPERDQTTEKTLKQHEYRNDSDQGNITHPEPGLPIYSEDNNNLSTDNAVLGFTLYI